MYHLAGCESAVRNELSDYTPPIAAVDRADPLLSIIISTLHERDNVRAVGAVRNYALESVYTWARPKAVKK